MQLHLDEISKNVTKGYHAVIVMDRAGWHLAKDLKIPFNISLMSLPPYSPELNPMEQVFQQLRKLKLSNACYESYDEIDQACVNAWNSFVEIKRNIKRLCLRDWANAC
jgi:transposase